MKVVHLLLLCVAACTAESIHILSDEFINEINSKQSTWKAGRNFDPTTPTSHIRSLLGVTEKVTISNVNTIHHDVIKDDIPETFDARENWKNCQSIQSIPDQSACGSYWAVASTSAMSDRVCIATNGTSQPIISAANVMSCCTICGYGCEGGQPIKAWQYWIERGIVTGGGYNTTVGCISYPFPPCEHHSAGSKPHCSEIVYDAPICNRTCETDWKVPYDDSLTFGSSYYFVKQEEQIQAEIMKNGPLVADFMVYSDFFSYKSGVYKHVSGEKEGGHAVRVLGWGLENGVKFWLMANSWNSDWGDNGTFKILRGHNECQIEEQVSAGLPKTADI